MSKCDLHIHSRHSARSEEWLFRRFDFPDSYSDPKQLYEQLRKRGMDYVTITDHDSIDGCLEIAHLPRTFISEQVTTYFPHDGCKLHILVWGISEQQHREIESVRENIFDLQRYLQRAQIAHAVAHPLIQRERQTRGNASRAAHPSVQTFRGHQRFARRASERSGPDSFQAIDAGEDRRVCKSSRSWRPRTRSRGEKSWWAAPTTTAGSLSASAFTETPAAKSAEQFLKSVRNGNCTARAARAERH